ncbi:MAG: hypothetical protein HQL82_12140 [Magnetococcales bacterium]|nr:hypothetical protein [Magnetococcales bacterium]
MANDSEHSLRSLTPEGIEKLERLKVELEQLRDAMSHPEGKSRYELDGRIRAYQDKEHEVRRFLRDLGLPGG